MPSEAALAAVSEVRRFTAEEREAGDRVSPSLPIGPRKPSAGVTWRVIRVRFRPGEFVEFKPNEHIYESSAEGRCARPLGGDVIKASWGGWFHFWRWSCPVADKNLMGFDLGAILPVVLVLSNAVTVATRCLAVVLGKNKRHR